jgi:hypothetical protein
MLEHFDAIPGHDSSAFRFAADSMLHRGYGWDYVSDRQLAGLRVEGSALRAGDARYRTVLVPAASFIPLETMQQLIRLAEGGATIAFYRGLPADVAGLASLARRRARLRDITASLRLAPMAGGTTRRAVVGRGAVLVGDDLNALLAAAAGVRRERATDMGLRLVRRREGDGFTHFIVNRGTATVDGWVPLATTGRSAAVYAPMHGISGMGRVRTGTNGTEVYLQIPAGASRIVRTYDREVAGAPWSYLEPAGSPVPVNGSWTLTFLTGGPALPAEVRNAPLGSWTDLPGDAVKSFSGTARYAIDFARPSAAAGATSWRLDLGTVHESARITLNGSELGTFIGPWFRVDVPAGALRETNRLEVFVSNLMANRIADLDRRGVPWKKFYNTNMPARLAANRGPDGLFTAARWTPLPSGLAGPVTLTPMRPRQF